jgi:hypothetical protein
MHEKEEKIQKLSILGRDPEFGMMKDSVVRDHQYSRAPLDPTFCKSKECIKLGMIILKRVISSNRFDF